MESATRILNTLSALILLVTIVYVQVRMGPLMSDLFRFQTGLAGLGLAGLTCRVWTRKGPSRNE